MKLGIDVSTYLEEVQNGAKYYRDKVEIDPLDEFRKNGVEYSRIRVWNNPYSPSGEPYLAGSCDVQHFVRLATLMQQKGYKILLDFHYSDFWADPGKQFLPKEWVGLSLDELCQAVENYTASVLKMAADAGVEVSMVQVGNEITNGMLWPVGKLENEKGERGNYHNFCRLLKAGVKAVREHCANCKIVLHLERSNDKAVYQEFFDNMQKEGVDYDVIGASYYPYWHGTINELMANFDALKRFGKQIMIMELGYGFTLEAYSLKGEKQRLVIDGERIGADELVKKYPVDEQGQARFVHDVLESARSHGVDGVFYWEPLWIPGEKICWASHAGQEYINESGKSTSNEWANQCLFDYEGNMLKAFDEFRV